MANEQNLIPFDKMSEERHRELSVRGAMKANETKRKKKMMREEMLELLECPIPDEWKEIMKTNGMDFLLKADSNMQTVFIASLFRSAAVDGNSKLAELALALIGEKPVEEKRVEVKADENYKKIAASLVNNSVTEDDTL